MGNSPAQATTVSSLNSSTSDLLAQLRARAGTSQPLNASTYHHFLLPFDSTGFSLSHTPLATILFSKLAPSGSLPADSLLKELTKLLEMPKERKIEYTFSLLADRNNSLPKDTLIKLAADSLSAAIKLANARVQSPLPSQDEAKFIEKFKYSATPYIEEEFAKFSGGKSAWSFGDFKGWCLGSKNNRISVQIDQVSVVVPLHLAVF